ncbi:MAG TPA: S24/S26 family peptidase [Candidatus Baltobacteraceae bacterium]|nr:S24/S26 family peptidase [Candidatus Baltobacteraceae bacterium]
MTQEREAVEMALAEEVLRSYGRLRMVARGSSMVPSIFPGDVLVIKRDPLARLRPGHIVLASRDGRFFAHRVVRLTALGGKPRVITRGDALNQNDPAFLHDEILGRVTAVIRGQKNIQLVGEDDLHNKRFLRWAIRNSRRVAAGVLWFHSCFTETSPAAEAAPAAVPVKLADCS